MPGDEARFTFRLPADAAEAIQLPDPAALKGGLLTFRCGGRESAARIEDATADERGLLITMVISDLDAPLPMGGGPASDYSPVTYGPPASPVVQTRSLTPIYRAIFF
jgi:hypothetical protein